MNSGQRVPGMQTSNTSLPTFGFSFYCQMLIFITGLYGFKYYEKEIFDDSRSIRSLVAFTSEIAVLLVETRGKSG